MKIIKFENEKEWMDWRDRKITGSRLKEIFVARGTNPKKGFYELIAERLAIKRPEGENVMQRGHELELTAIGLLSKEISVDFITDLHAWERDDNENIAISPDAYTEDLTIAAEVKCLCSADHIKAVILNEYPKEYKEQVVQYFIVNEKLQTLYFTMYDPSLSVHSLKIFKITREELLEDIEKYLEYERKTLEDVSAIVKKLSF